VVSAPHSGVAAPEWGALTTHKLTVDTVYLDVLFSGESGCIKDALLGDVQVEGNLLDIKCFVGYFDFAETPIALMVDWTLWRSSNLLKCGHINVAPI
jgi:hypothetical protein